MTLKQLGAFYWAATLGHFGAAATRLHLTPSTLSKRIAELEGELDCKLFNRSSQRVTLTAQGEVLIEHAKKMLNLESEIKAKLVAPISLRGLCRFGITELAAMTWLPKFIRRVRERYPELTLEPHVELTDLCERRLLRGELDFALIPGPSGVAGLHSTPVTTLKYSWLGSPDRIAPNTRLTPALFSEHPVMLLSRDAQLTKNINQWAADKQIEFQRALSCNSLMALIDMTIAGIGIGYFSNALIQPYVDAGLLNRLESDWELPTLTFCFTTRQDDNRHLNEAMREVLHEEIDFSQSGTSLRFLLEQQKGLQADMATSVQNIHRPG